MASSWDWTTSLSESDKRTVVLALAYESLRRKTQFGYQVFDLTKDPTQTPGFKAFRTVEKWLDDQHARIAWGDVTWKGYITFVFEHLKPLIPQPGQLKNPLLLKKYLTTVPVNRRKNIEGAKKLEALYRKHVRPELLADPGLMELLGLRNIHLYEDENDDQA